MTKRYHLKPACLMCLVNGILLGSCYSTSPTSIVESPTETVMQIALSPSRITTTPAMDATALEATVRAQNIIEATTTIGALQTTLAFTRTPKPTLTRAPTPSLTPTADYKYLANAWVTAMIKGSGIEFDYPLIYAYPPFSDIGCAPGKVNFNAGNPEIWVGQRIWIRISQNQNQSVSELATKFIGDGSEVRNAGQHNITVGGESAIRVIYRFGLTNRYGDIVFVVHNERTYEISFTAGIFCELNDTQIQAPSEFEAYERLLQTLKFTE